MKDQELFKQLHSLSKMAPDETWKKSQRSRMLTQLNLKDEDNFVSFSLADFAKLPLNFFQTMSQATALLSVMAMIVLTGGLVGLRVAQDTKPGDSLYIAKIVGEKTQYALAISEKKKLQLGLAFAAKRASEIEQLMSKDSESDISDADVEKLVQDLRAEIDVAKTRVERIATTNGSPIVSKEVVEATSEEVVEETKEILEEEGQVFTAGSSRDERGIQISEKASDAKTTSPVTTSPVEVVEEKEATTTEPIVEAEVVEEEADTSTLLKLEQAEELSYADADAATLIEIHDILTELIGEPKVKGASEEVVDEDGDASSTEAVN